MKRCIMTIEQWNLTYRFRILVVGNVIYLIYSLADVLITI